ncbi:chloride intracellular channel exc-4 family protein [Trichuris suis]|nr:chloride intracellular channel exc-4 family protein [Trichuris suis]
MDSLEENDVSSSPTTRMDRCDRVKENNASGGEGVKPFLELFVKASGIDNRRIGACLFCQEFWMELYALYEINLVRVEVKTVNVNSEPFKRSFLGALPPILVEPDKELMYTDNREIERRIFHIAKEFSVPLFEKDITVDKSIESLYRNFKVFLRAKTDYERENEQPSSVGVPTSVVPAYNKLVEQLTSIDKLLAQRNTRYLVGSTMTMYDCELMPRLHHIRIAGQHLCAFEIPHSLVHLWNYMLTAYRTAAFIESCPADQDISYHYKEQLNLPHRQKEYLQMPIKTHTIPDEALENIKQLGLDKL